MRYDSIPDLTATMRSHCPMGMGNGCACAARIEGRLDAGESAEAILAEYDSVPMGGVLVIDLVMMVTAEPPTLEEVGTKIRRLRELMAEPDAEDMMSHTGTAIALLAADIMSDMSRLHDAGIVFDPTALDLEPEGWDARPESSFDVDAFLADIATNAAKDSAGGNPARAKVDETVLA